VSGRDGMDVSGMALQLIIGNKNYSSWSMRPWMAMKIAGIAFEERVISLDDPVFKAVLARLTPAGKVPVLIDGDRHIWESLAIIEYVAEKFPGANVWPADPAARAHARVIAAEMHAGFAPLRSHCAMNMARPPKKRELPAEASANVARIEEMWADCRRRFGKGGPFLFGTAGAADAMYAPVVSRFHTYEIEVDEDARAYMAAVKGLPAWIEWEKAALQESWVLPRGEVDWPDVLRP
jgi:glutathione S-transferase